MSHPLRLRILSLLTGVAMSSAELARELDMNHAAVSFHVRKLADAGYLELAQTRSVRGGKERRYRSRAAGAAQWQREDPRLCGPRRLGGGGAAGEQVAPRGVAAVW